MKKIIIIGSTGSIGRNAIKVLSNKTLAGRFKVVGLSANSNLKLLEKQILSLKPEAVCSGTESDAEYFKNKFPGLMVYWGNQGLKSLAASSADLVLIAVVGAVGMYPLVSALEAGKTVALANKESLVIAGGLISNIVNKGKGKIIPVDSEHSAVFQCLLGEDRQNIKRLILTGSGGPFYNKKINFSKITVQEALRHPNWKMGKKITIDSATLMNKGL
ncbi:MAG: 1-deoxy-D-xylulose-5-phosphate reductoisomerase, partial [Elusimicrobiota bacterium]